MATTATLITAEEQVVQTTNQAAQQEQRNLKTLQTLEAIAAVVTHGTMEEILIEGVQAAGAQEVQAAVQVGAHRADHPEVTATVVHLVAAEVPEEDKSLNTC